MVKLKFTWVCIGLAWTALGCCVVMPSRLALVVTSLTLSFIAGVALALEDRPQARLPAARSEWTVTTMMGETVNHAPCVMVCLIRGRRSNLVGIVPLVLHERLPEGAWRPVENADEKIESLAEKARLLAAQLNGFAIE
jgi:hypothetical protein